MRILGCLISIWMAVGSPVAGEGSTPDTLEQALEKAKAKRAYVVVAIYDNDCEDCRRFDNETFPDDRIVDWLDKRGVLVRVNRSEEAGKAVAEKYRISDVPSILILSSHGRVLGVQPAFVPPLRLMLRLEAVVNSRNIRSKKGVLDAWAGQDVVLAAVDRAKIFAREGRLEEAHVEINWAIDHSAAKSPLFQVKHLAELMSVYATIAKQHSPAMEELKTRLRVADRAVVRSRRSQTYEMYFIRGGYRSLEQPEKIVDIYDRVKRITPDGVNVAAFRQLIYAELLDAQRYDELMYTVDDGADVDLFLEEARKTRRSPESVRFTLAARYEILLGLARFDDAKILADKLVAYADTPATLVSLAEAAYRSGRSTHHDVHRTTQAYETTGGRNANVATALAYLLASRSSSPDKAIKIINDTKEKVESDTAVARLDKCLADIQSGNIRMAAMTRREPIKPKYPHGKRKY